MRLRLLGFSVLAFAFISAQAQLNLKPVIVGQNPVSTKKNTPVTVQLTDLLVLDLDDLGYPQGFTLKVSGGKDYELSGNTVTPKPNFLGTLKVPVKVNDGDDDSKSFELKITVVANKKPTITGQEVLSMTQRQNIAIQLSNLKVTDADNSYPQDFTLTIYAGANYAFNGPTITPDASFTGTLTVQVSVNDGTDESAKFNLKIEVKPAANVPPEIKGQDLLTTKEDNPITLKLDDLDVNDPDNTYPNGFTMKVAQGTNYTVSGLKVTPAQNFSGDLSVPVTVNDGTDESAAFNVSITVSPENDKPVITAQQALSTTKGKAISVELTHLTVADPDNKYPDDFTLAIASGSNYSVNGKIITPAATFTGTLTADVTVNDGKVNSDVFKLKITVTAPVNIKPVITGQQSITTIANSTVTIQLTDLTVSDADNSYPQDFKLILAAGDNYTFSGTTVTPMKDFTGVLTIPVRVNDGTVSSNPFNLKITVQAGAQGIPLITGQKSLHIKEDQTLTLEFSSITVEDKDSSYPNGFTLNIMSGKNYTNDGLTIVPTHDYNGYLIVGVTVNDGKNTSPVYNLAVLIDPVNDPPQFISFETDPLSYEPGSDPAPLSEILEIGDVDNETLSFAEVGMRADGFHQANDVLIFENTPTIRGVYDAGSGILSLIGIAPVSEYRDALRSIRYIHKIKDADDVAIPVTPGPRVVYFTLNDGIDVSATQERTILVETILLDIPTGFTPNGDSANDTWVIRALTNPDQFERATIRIYNKRGLKVYQATGFDQSWDGYYNGDILPADTYFYTIDLKLSYAQKSFQGVVAILR